MTRLRTIAPLIVAAALAAVAVLTVQQAGCDEPGRYELGAHGYELVGGCIAPGDLVVPEPGAASRLAAGRPAPCRRRAESRRRGRGQRASSAARRSSTRSSTSSMPTESRTRLSGTSSAEPATEAWVIAAGCSISDSTPPSDSARVKISVAAQTRSAASRPPADGERHHAAEAAHLLGRDLVPGVRGQARVVHPLDRRVAGEQLGDPLGVVAVPLHPHREGLHPAQGQPGVERAGHRAGGVLGEAQLLGQRVVAGHQRAADHVGVAADVLRGRVQHHVGAQRERGLQVGRGEGVVHHQPGAGGARDVGDRGDVGDAQQRVGRRLAPDQLRVAGAARRAARRRSPKSTGVYWTPQGASTLSTIRKVPP